MSVAALETSAAMSAANTPVPPKPTKDVLAARKAAEDFESVFINEMLGSMFAGVSTGGPFGGGPGEQIYRSLMLDEYSKTIVKQGGFGLAAQVQRELLRAQGNAP